MQFRIRILIKPDIAITLAPQIEYLQISIILRKQTASSIIQLHILDSFLWFPKIPQRHLPIETLIIASTNHHILIYKTDLLTLRPIMTLILNSKLILPWINDPVFLVFPTTSQQIASMVPL